MPSVLVTGANRGIGLELARAYVGEGWTVLAACRRPGEAEDLAAIAATADLELVPLDVADADSVDGLARRLGGRPLDVLINNAGSTWRDTPVGALDHDRWRALMEVNLYGPVRVLERLMPNLEAGVQKKAVAISSSLGSLALGGGGNHFYRASKAALNMAMRSLGHDLSARGLTVAVLSPGFVDTDLTRGIAAPKITAADSARGLLRRIEALEPLGPDGFLRYNGDRVPW